MKKLCRQAGVHDKGTKVNCVIRVRENMNTWQV